MTALLLGTVLAVAGLAFVLHPLFVDRTRRAPSMPTAAAVRATDERAAVAALREVEFDRATGKLSERDYMELRQRLAAQAIGAMRAAAGTRATGVVSDEELEATILRYRGRTAVCARCGPRPEPDAVYCSECGTYLPVECTRCHSPVTELGAQFCASCGERLAA